MDKEAIDGLIPPPLDENKPILEEILKRLQKIEEMLLFHEVCLYCGSLDITRYCCSDDKKEPSKVGKVVCNTCNHKMWSVQLQDERGWIITRPFDYFHKTKEDKRARIKEYKQKIRELLKEDDKN